MLTHVKDACRCSVKYLVNTVIVFYILLKGSYK